LPLPTKTAKAVKIRAKSVAFGGSVITVKQDDGSGDYPTPHWKDNSVPADDDNDDVGDHNFPVAYVRNTSMVLTAEFEVEPASALGGATSATVTGTGSAGGTTYVFTGTATVGGGLITLSNAQANVPLPNRIDYFNRLDIGWTIAPNGGSMPNCGPLQTKHRVYVLLGTPNTGSRFETLIHLSCTDAAGKDNENDAVPAIWNEFTDRVVTRKPKNGFNNPDGVQMLYWNPPSTVSQTLEGMLAQPAGNGSCVAWAGLLHEALGAQGIASSQVHQVTATYRDDPSMGGGPSVMLVKNWSFIGPGSAPPACTLFTYLPSEITDLLGAPAQANADPPGGFFNHFIVRYSGNWYDPSYGTGPFVSDGNWENAALDGYKKLCAASMGEVAKPNSATLVEVIFVPVP
jgi:hypothetical protein